MASSTRSTRVTTCDRLCLPHGRFEADVRARRAVRRRRPRPAGGSARRRDRSPAAAATAGIAAAGNPPPASSLPTSTAGLSNQLSAVSPLRCAADRPPNSSCLELPRHHAPRCIDALEHARPVRRGHVQTQKRSRSSGSAGSGESARRGSSGPSFRPCAASGRRRASPPTSLLRHRLRVGQPRQHLEQRWLLQPPVAAAAHQLQGLDDEFDFANPSRPRASSRPSRSRRATSRTIMAFISRSYSNTPKSR